MGFGDALSNYRTQETGFAAVLNKNKKQTQPQPKYYTLNEAGANINRERRLEAAGEEVPQEKPKTTFLGKVLDILDRPAAAARGAFMTKYTGGTTGEAWEAAKRGFTGKEKVHASDILEEAARKGAPLGKWAQKGKVQQFIADVGLSMALDPTTFLTGGTTRVAQTGGKLAKGIEREVFKETGKRITSETAERLAQNAMQGNVPIGRLGTAIRRAQGYAAETKEVATGFGAVLAAQKQALVEKEARGFGEVAKRLKAEADELKRGKLPIAGYLPVTPNKPDFVAGYKAAPQTFKVKRQSEPIDTRTFEEVGSRKYKAYQWEHPELAPFIQSEARRLLTELQDTVKGEKYFVRTEAGTHVTGTKRFTSEPVARILEKTGATYKEVEDALNRIIRDEGLENTALAKKIELIIDDNLSRGAKSIEGMPLPHNAEYVAAKAAITGRKAAKGKEWTPTEADWNLLLGVETGAKKLPEVTAPEKVRSLTLKRLPKVQVPFVEALPKEKQLKATYKAAKEYGRGLAAPLEAQSKQAIEQMQKLTKKAEGIKPVPTMARLTHVAGEPGFRKTTMRFAGIPFLNVTPLRTAAGAVIERLPGATRVRDALGRVFSFNYTPTGIKGLERALVTGAKQRIVQGARETPFAREKGMREVAEQWKGTPGKIAKTVPHVIENVIKGTPEVMPAVRKAEELFQQDVEKFKAAGIPLNVIDNYVTHLYQNPPQEVRAVLDKWRNLKTSRQVLGAEPFFTRSRTAEMPIWFAKQNGLKPIEDVRVLTMIHRALTEQAVVLQEMGRDLVKMGRGVVQNSNPGGWVNVTDSAIPALQGKWVHPEVHQALKNLYPVLTNTDEGVNLVTRTVDAMMRAFKAVVLATPMFHIRNFVGNVHLNIADGVGNPLRYPQAVAVLTEAVPAVKLAGRMVPTKVIKEWFQKEALKGQGMFREAAGTFKVTTEAAQMMAALERSGLGKVAYWARHPFSASRAFGEHTDSLGRMANFLHHLDSGMSPAQAAERTRRALFDYGELTPAEQQIRRWVFPFYAWVRFSTPRMLERLLGAPGIFTGPTHIREAMVNLNEVDEQNLPQWLRDNQAIPLWVDDKGNLHYLSLNLPYTELSRLRDPRDFQEWAREMVTMVNPYITVPFQIAQNEMLFNDQKITEFEEIGGAPMWKDYRKFLLGHLGMSRQLVNQLGEWERQKQYEQAIAEGKGVEVPPVERGITEKLGITSAQSPAQWARSAEYRRGKLLEQAIKAARLQGKEIPEAKNLPALGEKKGGFGAALTARGGGGFGAVLRQQALKEVGEPPVVIKQAMDMAGVDQAWGPYLKLLMQSESGGNPMAVNPLWVNYNTGQTSRRKEGPGWYQATGLFQMMKPTFDQYKVPGYEDIYNPLDNTLAAINYIKARYGHPANIKGLGQDGYKGY